MSNPYDIGNLMGMLGGFTQKVQSMKEQAASLRVTGTAGGGLVTVVVTGEFDVASITISPAAYEDRELLEDLVRAATNDGLKQVRDNLREQMTALTGGLPIPPGMLGF